MVLPDAHVSEDAQPGLDVPDHLFGEQDGAAGIDDYFAARGFENVGALIGGMLLAGRLLAPYIWWSCLWVALVLALWASERESGG